ncbi:MULTISPECIES: MurR/RpiR family transcriptional regulator [Bacillaceae]|uniref:MurR/RpiR family transcriptional regulator n=1 Tax=Bacillaceae TaxID=186817 RepID=UPI000BFB3281|nr:MULTISPECIES: MurR/RpiR family transcriptional regulator [Bacillaceae]PGT76737.1 RpiR family transcriptional regulator [Bacillus sp. AFS040349]UGB30257.1 MurR/RpiR family transcriptional regulator [Metabacillus sp. B2-18]
MITFNWDTKMMSPSQYKIADYIQKNTQLVLLSTEQEIANAVKVSIASVSRFWRLVGYKNFKDFKTQMSLQLEVSPAGKMKNVMTRVEGQELQHHTLDRAVTHLFKTMEQFTDQSFQQAVNTLRRASTIYLHAPGPSLGLAELMDYRLSRFGMNLHTMRKYGSEIFEDLMHITNEDVVVLFGFIRLLPEANVILDYSNQVGYKTIIITDQLISEFSTKGDIVLFASRGDSREFHSMIAPMFIVENLIISLGMKDKEVNLSRLEQLSQLRKRYSAELPR